MMYLIITIFVTQFLFVGAQENGIYPASISVSSLTEEISARLKKKNIIFTDNLLELINKLSEKKLSERYDNRCYKVLLSDCFEYNNTFYLTLFSQSDLQTIFESYTIHQLIIEKTGCKLTMRNDSPAHLFKNIFTWNPERIYGITPNHYFACKKNSHCHELILLDDRSLFNKTCIRDLYRHTEEDNIFFYTAQTFSDYVTAFKLYRRWFNLQPIDLCIKAKKTDK